MAARAGCDVQTVRHYEREGLLPEPPREPSGYRNYGAKHLSRLRFVRYCRALDMPLAEVRQLLTFAARPVESCELVDELLDRKIALVEQRICALQGLHAELAGLRRMCAGDSGRACAILDAFVERASSDDPP